LGVHSYGFQQLKEKERGGIGTWKKGRPNIRGFHSKSKGNKGYENKKGNTRKHRVTSFFIGGCDEEWGKR